MTHPAVMTSLDGQPAGGSTPFQVVELTGRGSTYACDLPGPSPDAPTVVLLHGLFATGALNWSPFLDDLNAHYRVIAIDHRGHGRGIVGHDEFSLEGCADDVAALLGALGTGPAILVGYSMGGPIAQLVWRRHPETVRGLVLCATAGQFGLTPVDDLLLPVVERAGRALSLIPASIRTLIAQPTLSLLVTNPARKQEVAAALALHDMPSIRAAVRSILRFSSVDWLAEVAVPTAVVVTERDRVVTPDRQQQLVDLISDADAFRIDADHLACFDDAETFGAALLDACRSVTARSAPVNAEPAPRFRRLRARWRRWRAG
jgi:3-oxoadipate enol-lactonase